MKRLQTDQNKGYPSLKHALGEMLQRISDALPELENRISMYLAGGVAVNFYTGTRGTMDVDASFSRRLLLPPAEELVIPYQGPDGKLRSIHFDRNYNTTFAVLHEDFEQDSLLVEGVEFENRKIELRILSPVDLAVSKVARWAGHDQEDIAALARLGLINPDTLGKRAEEALSYFVGNADTVRSNLRNALRIVHDVQHEAH